MEILPVEFEYISLQKEVREADLKYLEATDGIRHFGEKIRDFTDTAALCEIMDIVISVDTSVAHLSGALGIPTWIMLPFNPDWRWLLARTDTPWYNSVRLFRQKKIGEWIPVFQELRKKLCQTYRNSDECFDKHNL